MVEERGADGKRHDKGLSKIQRVSKSFFDAGQQVSNLLASDARAGVNEQVEASDSLRDEVLTQAYMISDIVLDIRQKILDQVRTPDNLGGCILKEVDAFI